MGFSWGGGGGGVVIWGLGLGVGVQYLGLLGFGAVCFQGLLAPCCTGTSQSICLRAFHALPS